MIDKMNKDVPNIVPMGKLKDYLDNLQATQDKQRNSRKVQDDVSALSEGGKKLKAVKDLVFSKNAKEVIPNYLKQDFPTQKGKLAKEWALRQKKNGDRPTAEGF